MIILPVNIEQIYLPDLTKFRTVDFQYLLHEMNQFIFDFRGISIDIRFTILQGLEYESFDMSLLRENSNEPKIYIMHYWYL